MSLQNLSRFYWFVIDTKQVRDVAVFVSLSSHTAADQAAVRSRVRTSGVSDVVEVRTDRFKGL